jgi:hypothetical protein
MVSKIHKHFSIMANITHNSKRFTTNLRAISLKKTNLRAI